jgi:hypothetical protein
MKNAADVTGGKPIVVLLQSISGVSAINPLVSFYDMEERDRCYSFSFIILVYIFSKTFTNSFVLFILFNSE